MQQVTQKKMAKYAALGNKIEQLRKEFCQMKDEIISDLDAGAKPEAGARTASITHWGFCVVAALSK